MPVEHTRNVPGPPEFMRYAAIVLSSIGAIAWFLSWRSPSDR
jgi:hypothetical protein